MKLFAQHEFRYIQSRHDGGKYEDEAAIILQQDDIWILHKRKPTGEHVFAKPDEVVEQVHTIYTIER